MNEEELTLSFVLEYLARQSMKYREPVPRKDTPLHSWFARHPDEKATYLNYLSKEFQLELDEEKREKLCSDSPERVAFAIVKVYKNKY